MTAFVIIILLLIAAAVIGLVKSSVSVPHGMIGVVERRLPPMSGHDSRDVFPVRMYGSQGFQAKTLEQDRRYVLSPLLYKVTYEPLVNVPTGSFAVVVAKVGLRSQGAGVLCENVECDSFQDGEAFLRGGGQMGRQSGILIGGNVYAINPKIFDVITVDNVGAGRADLTIDDLRELHVPVGSVGVVITRDGRDPENPDEPAPPVPGHDNFRYPSRFLQAGGLRGVQEQTLSPGVYRINPWFARMQVIPTRDVLLEWSARQTKTPSRFDGSLDEMLVNVEGHPVAVGMTQVIRIPPQAAPRLVNRFGEEETDRFGSSNAHDPVVVQRFVERVIGGQVEGILRQEAAKYTYRHFVENYNELRRVIEAQLASALAAFGVIPVRTTLAQFNTSERAVDQQVRRVAEEREKNRLLEEKREGARTQADIDRVGIEVEAERRKLDTIPLERQIALLGADQVAMERIVTRLAQAPVPGVVVGGDVGAILRQMPPYQARELLDYAYSGTKHVIGSPAAPAAQPGPPSVPQDTVVPAVFGSAETMTLLTRVTRIGPMQDREVRALAVELAGRLCALHRTGAAHGGLNPSSVQLTGSKATLTRAEPDSPEQITFTAPERIEGPATAGEPSDVFSLGCTLFYAATGDSPFGLAYERDPLVARERVLNDPPNFGKLGVLSQELQSLIVQCLHKHPSSRPTARNVLDRLSPAGGS